ncbi:MAG: signal peptidase I [Nanoarchaeota archaeon]
MAKERANKHKSLRYPKNKNKYVRLLKKCWYFIWYDDSVLSWIVNLVLAFLLIKFIVYPGLGLVFGTHYPIVAVVSGSMEHDGSFEDWWTSEAYCGDYSCTQRCVCQQRDWYSKKNISEQEFRSFPFVKGFNKGDIMILFGINPEKIKTGDVIVFNSQKPYPIIHRVVGIDRPEETPLYMFETKGDHNKNYINDGLLNELSVTEPRLLGKAVARIPYLGYIKIWFSEYLVSPFFSQ